MILNRTISLKQGLLLIVLAALLPLSFTSVIQTLNNWNSMKKAAIGALHANAKAVSERERDAFLIANRMLMVAAANTDIKNMSARCNETLRAGFAGYEPIINFVRADADSKARCSILPFRQGTSFKGEAWWEKTKLADRITVSQPIVGTVARVPVIIIALPLHDNDGAFVGTLSAGLDISKLAKSVANAPEAQAGAIAVISRDGAVVASSRPTVPFAISPMLTNGSSGTARAENGTKWIYETESLSGNELFVVYAEPRAQIMAAALSQFRASIILPIFAIILTLSAIWFGTNRLVIRWLSSLRELSDEFTKGNFAGNRENFASAPLELRELSDDLHDMVQVIESRTAELTKALEAKTNLTHEVHHRVKNNLQIVTSLLTMQASRMTDEGSQSALRQARTRIAALALIHRLTYEKEGENARGIVTIENLMEELCKQLRYANRENRNIDLTCETDEFAFDADLAVPLVLFTVEAVTNSYRHAFASGTAGKIDLNFRREGDCAVLSICDNGQGYDVDNSAQRDLGFELMQGFASQLAGDVTFLSDPQNGSSTILRFPAALQSLDEDNERALI